MKLVVAPHHFAEDGLSRLIAGCAKWKKVCPCKVGDRGVERGVLIFGNMQGSTFKVEKSATLPIAREFRGVLQK